MFTLSSAKHAALRRKTKDWLAEAEVLFYDMLYFTRKGEKLINFYNA
jgi:hypothetical protein